MTNLNVFVTEEEIKAVAALSDSARADLAARIKSTDPFSIFDSAEGKTDEIICPVCGSGTHGNHNTGIKPTFENGVWLYHCFAGNDCEGTLIDIIAQANNLSTRGKDFFQVLAIAAKILGINIYSPADETSKPKKFSAQNTKPVEIVPAAEYSRLAESRENISSFVESQGGKWRGLTLDTLKRLNWGFLQNYKHPDNNFIFPAIVIPNDLNGILARHVDGDGKSNISPTATTTIFLPDSEEFDLIVTEGAINGASILQAFKNFKNPPFGIIASGGTSGGKNVLAKLQQLKSQNKKIRVLVAYDNDSNQQGQNAAKKLVNSLIKTGYPACSIDITQSPDTDLNNILQQDEGETKLFELIDLAITLAQEELNLTAADIAKFADTSNFDTDTDSEINSLKAELQEVENKIAEFDAEKNQAIESLTQLETFDSDTVFSDKVLTAAAFAKNFNRQVFSELKTAIQKFKKAHAESGVSLPDFNAALAEFEKNILSRRAKLETQRTKIKAKIKTLNFAADDDFLMGLTFPDDYVIDENGIGKVAGENIKTICRRPVLVTKKFFAVDEEVTKLILAFKNGVGVWKNSAPTPRAEIVNAKDLVKLANSDFPFTSQNVGGAVEYLDAFLALNEKNLSTAYSFKNFGWHEFKEQKFFLDPRRNTSIEVDGKFFSVCCTSKSQFARALKSVGNLEKWRQIYNKVKKYPVARFTVAAAVAAPLLEILGERGFWIHTHTQTRSGKSTTLKFSFSAVGNPDGVIKNFNATLNGLQGVAAEYNGFSFPIDEWQAASDKLKSQVSNLIHNLIDGTARTKMNKDSTVRENETWLTIVLTNGETVMLNDNSLGGEFTRVLNIAAPSPILPPELCKEIHDTIKDNHGLIFPLILDELQRRGENALREMYSEIVEGFMDTYFKSTDDKGKEKENFSPVLSEYCRYIAVVSIADIILNVALGENEESAIDTATDNADEIFKLIPTVEEIDDAARAKEMLLGFIAKYSAHFEGMEGYEQKHGRDTYGKTGNVGDRYFYITVDAVKIACKENDFEYKHLVKNLIDDGFFIPADKVENGRKKPRHSVISGINGVNTRCYRIIKEKVIDDD